MGVIDPVVSLQTYAGKRLVQRKPPAFRSKQRLGKKRFKYIGELAVGGLDTIEIIHLLQDEDKANGRKKGRACTGFWNDVLVAIEESKND